MLKIWITHSSNLSIIYPPFFLKLQHLSDVAGQEVIQQLNQLVLLSRKISTFGDIIESLLITEMIHSFNLH